jgi:hypothetical protein
MLIALNRKDYYYHYNDYGNHIGWYPGQLNDAKYPVSKLNEKPTEDL